MVQVKNKKSTVISMPHCGDSCQANFGYHCKDVMGGLGLLGSLLNSIKQLHVAVVSLTAKVWVSF
jgi:hypothetical protein